VKCSWNSSFYLIVSGYQLIRKFRFHFEFELVIHIIHSSIVELPAKPAPDIEKSCVIPSFNLTSSTLIFIRLDMNIYLQTIVVCLAFLCPTTIMKPKDKLNAVAHFKEMPLFDRRAFDTRWRLWVAEVETPPNRFPNPPGLLSLFLFLLSMKNKKLCTTFFW
jgi:hypothetical protein